MWDGRPKTRNDSNKWMEKIWCHSFTHNISISYSMQLQRFRFREIKCHDVLFISIAARTEINYMEISINAFYNLRSIRIVRIRINRIIKFTMPVPIVRWPFEVCPLFPNRHTHANASARVSKRACNQKRLLKCSYMNCWLSSLITFLWPFVGKWMHAVKLPSRWCDARKYVN